MYVMNRGPRPKHRLQTTVASLLTVGLLVGGVIGARQYFTAETKIGPTPAATVTKVLAAESKTKAFNAGVLSISLPQDWEAFKAPDVAPSAYSWRNTVKNKGVEIITAYIDMVPVEFAMNRMLPVEAADDHIQQLGGVSDNCADFVEGGRNPVNGKGKVAARWSGIQFLCDNANFNRDVVGIASVGDVNGVTLTGPSGKHHIFVTYTDANATPDHSIFTNAIETLQIH